MNDSDHKQALPAGCELHSYRLLRVLGVGGFGVTYLAEHFDLNEKVAIKEYLPNELALREGATVHPKSAADKEDFEWGLARFLEEGRTLARFRHRNLVRVRDYFEANRTAYIVMDYEEGEPLDHLLARHGMLTEGQLRSVLLPVLDGLKQVHAAGFLHRDIKPSNVYVRRADESPVLLDFGAARYALGQKSRSMTAVVTAGYSPPEQYESEGEQGPWTDVYALSALCYRAITGETPVESTTRQRRLFLREADPLPRLVESAVSGYSKGFLQAVDRGLEVRETHRPQTLDELKQAIEGAIPSGEAEVASTPSRSPVHAAGPKRILAWVGGAVVAVALAALLAPRIQHWVVPGQATLAVHTLPSGAEVLVDGESVGKTPLETIVPASVVNLILEHPRYETIRLQTEKLADGQTLRIERALKRAIGALRVVTQPEGAWVERDGERLPNATPMMVENLPAGPLTLTLGASEHRSAEVQAQVPKDGTATLEYTLEPIPYGTLTLELDPRDAQVVLPNIGPSYSPGMRLPEGEYRMTVSRAGYRTATRTVRVSGDIKERIELVLNPQPFTVAVDPPNATVRVLNISESYRPGMPLGPGDYRVRVSAPEYDTHEESLSHSVEPTFHRVVLTRRSQRFTVSTTPSYATVSFVGVSSLDYEDGMRLQPGEYRIRVSADGYETKRETVYHRDRPTRHRVTLEPVKADIALAYTGDLAGCGLTISVRLGDRTVVHYGNLFGVQGLPTGRTSYSVSGSISCPSIDPITGLPRPVSCLAMGRGELDVRDGGTYYIRWVNDSPGQCTISLTE